MKNEKFTLTMMTLGLVATLGLAGCGKQEKRKQLPLLKNRSNVTNQRP